mgnify:CR=1 FL=1
MATAAQRLGALRARLSGAAVDQQLLGEVPGLAVGASEIAQGGATGRDGLGQHRAYRQRQPLVLMPNPFYQIYEGATLLAGGEPMYLPCTDATGLQPDFDAVSEDTWTRTQLLFICTPCLLYTSPSPRD